MEQVHPSLQAVIHITCQVTQPQKIYLLGYRVLDSIFLATSNASYHYYLLVLLPNSEMRSPTLLQDLIESRCKSTAVVTAMVYPFTRFEQWRQNGQPFARLIHSLPQNQLYQHPAHKPVAVVKPTAPTPPPDGYKQRARQFLTGAQSLYDQGQWPLCAFLLHQCMEQQLIGLALQHTGLYICTHNLNKLLDWCGLFVPQPAQLFPRHSLRDQQLFQLLQKAYIHSRYKEDFKINKDDCTELKRKVEEVVSIQW